MSTAEAAVGAMSWIVCALALGGVAVPMANAFRATPSPTLLMLDAVLWLMFMTALPVTAVLAWLADDIDVAVLYGGLWVFALLRMLFGGPRGRRRWRALVARVRDLGHRLTVQPAGAPA